MKMLKFLLLPLFLLVLCPVATSEENGKTNEEQKPAGQESEIQGLWTVREADQDRDEMIIGGSLESVQVSKDGTKYLIEIIGDMDSAYRTLAIREGDQLKIGHVLMGDMIFSDDGKRAYLGGSEFYKVPDHKVRDVVEKGALNRDRLECVMNIRNIQQAVRGHANMHDLEIGDPLSDSEIHSEEGATGYLKTPQCPAGGKYTFKKTVPKIGILYCSCSHAKEMNHVPEDHQDW